jgi:hypothetical protein
MQKEPPAFWGAEDRLSYELCCSLETLTVESGSPVMRHLKCAATV